MASVDAEPQVTTYACNACEDTHKVRLSLVGANGPVIREVPCPECVAGIRLDANLGKYDDLVERLDRTTWIAVIALAVGAAAFVLTRDPKKVTDKASEAVKEVISE